MSSEQSDKLVIWRIFDGRPGHDNQSEGLVNALGLITDIERIDIPAPSALQNLLNLLLHQFPPGRVLPSPHLIVGAGHKTHLALLSAGHSHGGKTVVIMRPTLPTDWFDLCLIPDHDRPTIKDNIFITLGALNTITPTDVHNPSLGLILVGGPSRHYAWNTDQVIEQISSIIDKTPQIHWTISDSSRTPAATSQRLKQFSNTTNTVYYSHIETPTGWVAGRLRESGIVWVTADSISMIYESLTSGAHTGILPVPFRRKNKITNVVNDLIRARMIIRFQDWVEGREFNPPPRNFNEADRAAREVLKRFKV